MKSLVVFEIQAFKVCCTAAVQRWVDNTKKYHELFRNIELYLLFRQYIYQILLTLKPKKNLQSFISKITSWLSYALTLDL